MEVTSCSLGHLGFQFHFSHKKRCFSHLSHKTLKQKQTANSQPSRADHLCSSGGRPSPPLTAALGVGSLGPAARGSRSVSVGEGPGWAHSLRDALPKGSTVHAPPHAPPATEDTVDSKAAIESFNCRASGDTSVCPWSGLPCSARPGPRHLSSHEPGCPCQTL